MTNTKEENPDYLSKQIITYIGSKRALLPFIGKGINIILKRLNKKKLKMFDCFSGSGIVARYCKQFSEKIIVNDIEKYSEIINKCYLTNNSSLDIKSLRDLYNTIRHKLKEFPLEKGIISEFYAPKDDKHIEYGERVFYTTRNAGYIDSVIKYINDVPKDIRHLFIAPLLSEASIHVNTAGTFKGFYKNSYGIGQFGGSNGDALFRIKGNIDLPFPIFSNFDCEFKIYNGPANDIVKIAEETDVAYIDPPYNQHPYGSNYFMLNILCDYKNPNKISRVSGIPSNWNRSPYNKKPDYYKAFSNLLFDIKAKYLLISFSSEGFIEAESMLSLLKKIGRVKVLEKKYNTFRASRNLKNRPTHIKEYLYILEKA